jgi:hypothetical protein
MYTVQQVTKKTLGSTVVAAYAAACAINPIQDTSVLPRSLSCKAAMTAAAAELLQSNSINTTLLGDITHTRPGLHQTLLIAMQKHIAPFGSATMHYSWPL